MAITTDVPKWYLRPFFAGDAAVIIFFVLSGYVLSLPVWKGSQSPYGRYLLRRLIRIYLPYAAAVILAFAVGSHYKYSHTGLSSWFYRTWQNPFSWRDLAQQLVWISTKGELNPAFWSLRYEVEMSLIFPFLCAGLLRLNSWAAFFLISAVWKVSLSLIARTPGGMMREPLITLSWCTCFLLGALLARERRSLLAAYVNLPTAAKAALFIVCVVPFFTRQPLSIPFAACALLIIVQDGLAYKALSLPMLEYLGRISFSMYLVHGTALWLVMILTVKRIPMAWSIVIAVIAVAVASHLFCIMVEEPTIRWGRRVSLSA